MDFDPIDETAALEALPADQGAPAAPKRRKRGLMVLSALLVAMLAGGGTAMALHKSVDVSIDGTVHSVGTFSATVAGALEAAGFEPAPHDVVAPEPEAELADGSVVIVQTAHEVEFDAADDSVTLWTTGRTAGEALADVALAGRDLKFQASRSSDGRPRINLPIVTDGTVIFEVDGESITENFTGTVDLAEALERVEITLNELDTTVVTANADGTPVVEITRIDVSKKTTTKDIDFTTDNRNTSSRYKGESKVIQTGKKGERTIVTEITRINGEVTEKVKLSNEITIEPVTKIVEIGTKARPVAVAPARSAGSSSSSSSSSSSGGGGGTAPGGVWGALAKCESGGNPRVVSASGTYHGLYQFSVATWRSVGGTGLPSQASAAEQTKRAQMLQARSGWGQWPACSKRIGVR